LYPSMGGIVSFSPGELNDIPAPSPVLVENIMIDNEKKIQSGDSIYLKAGFKYLAIEFVTPHFADPRNLLLEYRLDSTGWKKITLLNGRQLWLADISPGSHRLQIRKRTGFGNADYVYKTLTLIKQKSIFEQVWFYLLLLLAAGMLMWVFIQFKTRNINRKRARLQKKVNQQTLALSKEVEVKDLLISIISHDMTTPLRYISLVSDVLAKGHEKDPAKVAEALNDIKSTSDKVLSGSLMIINWMKYNNKKIVLEKTPVNLHHIVNEILGIYTAVAKRKAVHLINEVPSTLSTQADRTILSAILNNLISNAVKYTDAGNIRIYTQNSGKQNNAILNITDTGQGITKPMLYIIREALKGNLAAIKNPGNINTGLGYVMIGELLAIHGFTLTIESELQTGTTVALVIT
jgi:signal transduction histidine kinase